MLQKEGKKPVKMGHISLAPDLRHFTVHYVLGLGAVVTILVSRKSRAMGRNCAIFFVTPISKNNFEEFPLNFDSYRLGTLLPPFCQELRLMISDY